MWSPGSIARLLMRLFGRRILRRGIRVAASPEVRERFRAWVESTGEKGAGMFDRFDDEARRAVVKAQDEARALSHGYVGTEHLLLGLLADENLASASLAAFDVHGDRVRDQVRQLIGVGSSAPQGHIPFTPKVKQACSLALREALQLGARDVGAEHLLLGLLREGEGVASRALMRLDVDLGDVRAEGLRRMRAAGPPSPPDAAPLPRQRLDLHPDLVPALDRISLRLDAIESRLATLEQHLTGDPGR